MKKPYLSIRYKLLLSILLILLVSYSILLFTSVRNFDAFVAKEIRKDLDASLNFAVTQYFSRANQIKPVLMQPAHAPAAHRQIRLRNKPWLKDALRRWRMALPFADVLTVVGPRMNVLARLGSNNSGDLLQLQALLRRAFSERQPVISTELVSGAFLCREGQSFYCAPGAAQEAMMMTVVIPVVAPSGELLGGIVAGDVINSDSYYPYQFQKIFGREIELTITQRGKKIASSLENNDDFAAMLAPDILATLAEGKTYHGEARIGGKIYRTAFEPITDSRGTLVGSISVAMSKEDFLRIRRDNEYNVLVSALVGIILSFAMALVVTKQVTRPLKALSRSVSKIEEGDLNQRVLVATQDELGMLTDSFNRMANALAERDGTIKKKNQDLQELNELLEKRVAERTAELRIEMERLETVLTCMLEGIVVTDRENRVILFNPAAQKLFNLVPHRVVGQPVDRLCELAGFPALGNEIGVVRTGGTTAAVIEQDLALEGKKLKVNLSPLGEGGTFAGVVMSIRDVTLEEVVDKMKTEFISTVSHELKTPLTSMKGSLQYILGKGKWLTGTERELLSVCLRNTDRLIRLISDILDISKIEEGRIELLLKPHSLRELVAYAIEEVNPLAMERTITIINEIGDKAPYVCGDYDRLVQVVTNLLSNAVKFSPMSKVVTVSADRDGNYMAVTVTDRGTPIPLSDRDKLFRKFQRLDNTGSGDRGGTGLGLVICKEIVERHHGRIQYQTGVTGGNAFTFTVPIFEGSP